MKNMTNHWNLLRTLLYPKILLSLVVSASCLSLISCGTVETTPFSEVSARFELLKQEQAERVRPEVYADCKDGVCEISENNLQILTDIISNFNDEVKKRVDAHNFNIDALTHAEYANVKLRESIGYKDNELTKQAIVSAGKQIITALTCGALLAF